MTVNRAYVRRLGPVTIANSGSVGVPWDDDPRASYLRLEDGQARIVRVEYDVEQAARATLVRTG